MTPVQYTTLAYAFAAAVLLGYSARLWLARRATRNTGKEDRS
jgi:hypothetical protein